MSARAAAPTPAGAVPGKANAIPFRSESGSVASDATGALLTVTLLLAAFVGLLLVARKKGWLDRWIGRLPAPTQRPAATLRTEQALRLSPRTMVYRVLDEGRPYLVVESTAKVQVIPVEAARGEGGHA